MARNKPSQHEDAEGYVASQLKFEVFENFGELNKKLKWRSAKDEGKTYSEENISNVHQAKDHVANLGLVIRVACEHQDARYDMMSEHLPVIFPPLFDIDDKDLLDPKAELNEVVPFHGPFYFSAGPMSPQIFHAHPMLVIVHDPLDLVLAWLMDGC